jgi:hypothetical protein
VEGSALEAAAQKIIDVRNLERQCRAAPTRCQGGG